MCRGVVFHTTCIYTHTHSTPIIRSIMETIRYLYGYIFHVETEQRRDNKKLQSVQSNG